MGVWESLPQQLVYGLALGSVYALIALGYSMVYGVLEFINFSHGEVFMVGAFAALSPSASARICLRQAARPAFEDGCSHWLWSKCWRVISSPWFVVSC